MCERKVSVSRRAEDSREEDSGGKKSRAEWSGVEQGTVCYSCVSLDSMSRDTGGMQRGEHK